MFNFFKKDNKSIIIKSPLNGKIIDIENVEDPVFASKVLGDGVAIFPDKIGKIFSPVNGVIETIFPTNHAIGINFENGLEILIHIGINTVELKGDFFKSYVKSGEKVNIGDLLIQFDFEKISELGYNLSTPIILTNLGGYSKIEIIPKDEVKIGDDLIKLIK